MSSCHLPCLAYRPRIRPPFHSFFPSSTSLPPSCFHEWLVCYYHKLSNQLMSSSFVLRTYSVTPKRQETRVSRTTSYDLCDWTSSQYEYKYHHHEIHDTSREDCAVVPGVQLFSPECTGGGTASTVALAQPRLLYVRVCRRMYEHVLGQTLCPMAGGCVSYFPYFP